MAGVTVTLYSHPDVKQLPYAHGRDYSKGFNSETQDDKILKLGNFIVDKLNVAVQDVRLGIERMSELYNLDCMCVAEPSCTTMTRMMEKTKECAEKFKIVEAHLTSTKIADLPKEKHPELTFPKADKIDVVINGFLSAVNDAGASVEDAIHRVNAKCAMNIRLEPKLDEPFLDMKQFISSVIRKWQRAAFGWQMIQIVVVTNNIDIEKASPALLDDARKLKLCYDYEFINAEEYADRRLQILDKMFMRNRLIDREQKSRWEKDEINLKDAYGERKVKLPDHYDRDHTDFDFYDQEQNDNEEVRRLRLLQIEQEAALEGKRKADPGLVKNNLETEVYSRKLNAGAGYMAVKGGNTIRPAQREVEPEQQFGVAAPVVHDDLEMRRRKFEEQQRDAERVRQERIAKGEAQPERAPKAKAANAPMPSSVNEIEAYKRAMIEKYESQQRENTAILARKKAAQG